MMVLVLSVATVVSGIVVLALLLPCEACRRRRERMRQAYAAWQARQRAKSN
jgi:hypothetical protein